ncbi:MAG: ATP-dependent 6-phosphofructokinase, partial [Spirochaetes bacterium]|nr:ATP-dependent 6-phosphofructokinase [Spirochaetota bacterium]
MENLDLMEKELKIDRLGESRIDSPLKLSTVYGDNIVNYVKDTDSIVFYRRKNEILDRLKKDKPLLAFETAGPRQNIYFDPSKSRAGIV